MDPRFFQLMARMMIAMAEGAEAAEKMWSGLRQALGSAEQYAGLMAELSSFQPGSAAFPFGPPLPFEEFQKGFASFCRGIGWSPPGEVENLREKIGQLEKKIGEGQPE